MTRGFQSRGILAGILLALSLGPVINASAAISDNPPEASSESGCFKGSSQDVIVMVDEAADLLSKQGAAPAFGVFNNPAGAFVRGDLYVFVLDFNGTIVAHGLSPDSIGNNVFQIRDSNGHFFIQSILRKVFTDGEGWVDYLWFSPCSGEIERKQVFFKRVGSYVICSGYYRALKL